MQPWLIPMLYVVGAVLGGIALPRIEHAWLTDARFHVFELSGSSARPISRPRHKMGQWARP